MSELPPRRHLARVVRALARHLPGQMAGLLEHARFAGGRAALGRLSADAAVEAAIAAVSPEEAADLAGLLVARWAQIGVVALDPDAAIVGPDELWLGDAPVRVALELQVVDAEPGWEAVWDGAAAGPDPARAVAVASPPGDEPAVLAVRAHVRARTAAGRGALVATARIALRRPRVIVADDRRRVIATDQAGRPAVGVRLAIGGEVHLTGPGGLVELAEPAAPDLPVRVEDILAGRIPACHP